MLKVKDWLRQKKKTTEFQEELKHIIQQELEKIRQSLGVKSVNVDYLKDVIKEEITKAKGGRL